MIPCRDLRKLLGGVKTRRTLHHVLAEEAVLTMHAKTHETCWFCEAEKADPSASVFRNLYRGKNGDRETKEVSIPRCSNCQKVHRFIGSMDVASLEPEIKEGKQIQIMKGVYVPLKSILIGFSILALFLLIGYLSSGDGLWMFFGTVGITIAAALLWAIVGGIKNGIKLAKAREQYLHEMGVKAEEEVVNHPDIGKLFEVGWKMDGLPQSKETPAIQHRPAIPVATSKSPTKPSKYSEIDGYLLPEYWRCIVCKASKKDKRADSAVRVGLFAMAIEDDSCFHELSQIERKAAQIYIQYISDPLGGVKARPPGTEQFEETAGLARDRNGVGFDAVFLCNTHADEMNKTGGEELTQQDDDTRKLLLQLEDKNDDVRTQAAKALLALGPTKVLEPFILHLRGKGGQSALLARSLEDTLKVVGEAHAWEIVEGVLKNVIQR